MKKLFAYAIAMSMAGTASAASIGFDFGTNFYKPAAAGYTTENGQSFAVSWNLDSDVTLGVYTEQSNVAGCFSAFSEQGCDEECQCRSEFGIGDIY